MRFVKARTAVLAATATVAVAAVAFGAGGGGRRLAHAVWDADAGKPEPVQAHRRRAR